MVGQVGLKLNVRDSMSLADLFNFGQELKLIKYYDLWERPKKKKLIIMYIQWTPMMWMDHLFSYDMNLDEWLSKFRLDRKYYRKELLVLDQEKTNGWSKNKKFIYITQVLIFCWPLQNLSHHYHFFKIKLFLFSPNLTRSENVSL